MVERLKASRRSLSKHANKNLLMMIKIKAKELITEFALRDKTQKKIGMIFLVFLTLCVSVNLNAQTSDDWTNLRRSIWDTDDATLRVPCLRLVDASGAQVAGLAPAFSINLVATADTLTLGSNLRALSDVPASCLDLLTLSSDGSTAIYQTSSVQFDSDAALFKDIYFTLELQASLAVSPVSFNVISATSRNYVRAGYQSDAVLDLITDKQRVFDDADLKILGQEIVTRLVVSEPGVYGAVCRYKDTLGGVIELIETVAGNARYRLNQSFTNANNGAIFFNGECDVYNRDLNLFETRLERIGAFVLALP
jgi:hypothetical protein